jgi:hypothetical protein
MNYFLALGLVFGTIALLKPVYIHLLPFDENKFIAKAYAEKRPAWIVPVVAAGLLLIAFTWYKHFTADVSYSLVLTLLFSLTGLKGLVLMFDYKKFQQWVAGMLQKNRGKKILFVDLGVSAFGLLIIVLSLNFY